MILAGIDVRHRIIPDETSIYATPFAIAGAAGLNALGYTAWPAVGWRAAAVGAAFWGGSFAAVAVISPWVLRREGLGWGDVKLVALIGAVLGIAPGGVLALFLGTMLASAAALLHLGWTRTRSYLPLGPFLVFGATVVLLYGDLLVQVAFPGLSFVDRVASP
jgi:leader peptidase (prepilin peptidase)/N-methyltransferase